MLSIAEQYYRKSPISPRHHYILLLKSADELMTKQVEMFAKDPEEAISLGCKSQLFNEVEIWEDGESCGVRRLPNL